MLYAVKWNNHELYSNVIEILRSNEGGCSTPFAAVMEAKRELQFWQLTGKSNIRILIDGQILNICELEKWARDEYQNLPKCGWCAQILGETIITHPFSGNHFFCRQNCADQDYNSQMEKMMEQEDCDL